MHVTWQLISGSNRHACILPAPHADKHHFVNLAGHMHFQWLHDEVVLVLLWRVCVLFFFFVLM